MEKWITEAREHWKEFRPTVYRGLKAKGLLESSLRYAAEQTALEMNQLVEAGLKEHEAWEMVRERYLFVPEAGKAPTSDTFMPSPPTTSKSPASLTNFQRALRGE